MATTNGPTKSDDVAKAHEYLAALPRGPRAGLQKLRRAILAVVPEGKLSFSYRMPAIRIKGRPVVWFAAFKEHSSFFPGAAAIRQHAAELKEYKISKGTIQFPHGEPPSAALVARLVRTRIADMQKGRR